MASKLAKAVVIPATSQHTGTVIFLHGLGDSGHGWAPVMKMIASPHIKYICPHAGTMPVTLNGGFPSPSWFDLLGLSKEAKEDEKGIVAAADLVKSLINAEIDAGIPSNRIILGGFSQGGALALYTGLTFNKPLGGILALSCYFPLRSKFPEALDSANANVPVFQAHGDCDTVLRYNYGVLSNEFLKSLNIPVEFKTYTGMPHSASDEEIEDVKKFIDQHIPRQ